MLVIITPCWRNTQFVTLQTSCCFGKTVVFTYSAKGRIQLRAFWRNQVYIWTYQKPLGKPTNPNQPERSRQKVSTAIGNTTHVNNTNTFGPMSPKVDMGPKVLFLFYSIVFPHVFDSFCLGLFGRFVFFGFPVVFDMFKRLPGNSK